MGACGRPHLPVPTRLQDRSSTAIRQALRITALRIHSPRLHCVDLLRGIVMILMALDHTRDFFTRLRFSPEDLSHTTAPLFLTRFVTHFCAPAFFLLAGMGGYLSLAEGKSLRQVSTFFWTRGLWLVFLEWTVMAAGWTFILPYWSSNVLCALGFSMILMALLVRLPLPWIGALGAAIIAAHNFFDGIKPPVFGKFAWLWIILHGHGIFPVNSQGDTYFVLFPVFPWVGVMAVGYALGSLLRREHWTKIVCAIGAGITFAFVLLRVFHLYGNGPADLAWLSSSIGPWKIQSTLTLTIIAFFDTLKYPPSLQFLLMTLGPTLIGLALLDKVNIERAWARILLVFGRVPLFFYVLHVYIIHILAVLTAMAFHQHYHWLLHGASSLRFPPHQYGHDLPFIYAMWIAVVTMLYFPCKWFWNIKQDHRDCWWMRYL